MKQTSSTSKVGKYSSIWLLILSADNLNLLKKVVLEYEKCWLLIAGF